jgi:hypothetical protein
LNSGINAAWILCYLATSPRWTAEVRKEVIEAANKYTTDPNLSLPEKLAKVPLEGWENDFPIIELCLRESMRLQLHGTGFRKNTSGKDISIGNDEVISPNEYLVCSLLFLLPAYTQFHYRYSTSANII